MALTTRGTVDSIFLTLPFSSFSPEGSSFHSDLVPWMISTGMNLQYFVKNALDAGVLEKFCAVVGDVQNDVRSALRLFCRLCQWSIRETRRSST